MANINLVEGASDAQIADWLTARIGEALVQSAGRVALALPGGSTPFPIIKLALAERLDWHRVEVFPTDDRMVEPAHPASNTGRLRELLEPAGARVTALADLAPDAVPEFALVWLGMGADGHIASLFPNTDPRSDDPQSIRKLTPDPLPPEAPFDRVTLTIPALLNAAEVLIVARGDSKRPVLDAAIAGASDLPIARFLAATHQPVTCFT